MRKKIDVVGEVYGRLTITGEAEPYITPSSGQVCCRVSYTCSCGGQGEATLRGIRNGNTRSCGCLKVGTPTKHGKSGTKLYNVYRNMLDRCHNPKDQKYVDYGGRGIKVCQEWGSGFEAFYKWSMKSGYEEGLSIERVDVNGDYTASNCTWITMAQQVLNRRTLKTNTSGITGVSYIIGKGVWIAQWMVGGKRKSRTFSVKKYGSDEAKQLAIDKRREMEKFLGITNNDPKTSLTEED